MSRLLMSLTWRRLRWTRFILYFLGLALVYHFGVTLWNSQEDQQQQQQQQSSSSFLSSPNTTPGQKNEKGSGRLDFPWYTQSHPALDIPHISDKFTTKDLSSTERQQLQDKAVADARASMVERVGEIVGIPGSRMTTTEKADRLRALVECWTGQGEWVKDAENAFRLTHMQDPVYGKCDKKFYKTNPKSSHRPATEYSWKTSLTSSSSSSSSLSCPLPEKVDVQKWCEVLNGRHLLLVGDLVQYQLHEILLDAMRDGPTVCFGELNCKEHSICTEPETHLRYLRNDILSINRRLDSAGEHPAVDIVEWPFVPTNIITAYPVMILNRSPVRETDAVFTRTLSNTLRVLRETVPDMLIIYRSSSIGHPHCDDTTTGGASDKGGPLDQRLTDDQEKLLPFGWSELRRRNAMAKAMVEAVGGVYVDLGALTDVRPDGHVGGQDCLRYCIPGPLDAWVQILYKLFLELENPNI
ncbi:hypothetical protein PHYBLDRAFT_186429 [Phycomyces blakesleeanus NRRL 1555(-)]|uniref:Trichome birefringence-like C-terminal domain-containing protein n=1 Tax=Phycomyces blakesleeanus (strain ATCC 8743b / DSM 1359 / FGSC 10004 / NBRC 33097 / NRRL 1555) TaxID=763407 RepID=A0A162UIP6_PHYB8|nr:hypothetical protein PHYBLDRAFT_186429 [Phycomyces blakesleeanus NRRL 1555(-)]OAD75533.1 hypothetical protein PHYBLDRAFT_186429 [Phycomyces blakesleeanus NRRL 1555(-)]|eukprot:XP_018293573.1 hypothetical protein PHYBLDRAFT_186429 [Phycomyces blakesleeanus NRRL 1555(-)]